MLAAELVHASGVVAVVVVGLALGHRWPTLMSAASRLQMEAFWKMVTFLLEGTVFLVVGLQLRAILADLRTPKPQVVVVTLVVLRTVIATRFVWVYPATYLPRADPPGTPARSGPAAGRAHGAGLGRTCGAWSRWPPRWRYR